MTLETMPAQATGTSLLATLMERASEHGNLDIDALGKMLDAYERWNRIEAEKAFIEAMAAFKANPPNLVKQSTVDFESRGGRTNYKYAGLAHVSDQIGEALAPHGLSHYWTIDESSESVTVTCWLVHRAGHKISTSFTCPPDATGNKNTAQQRGSAVTYGERYTLMALTGTAAGDQDDDSQAWGKQERQPAKAPDLVNDDPDLPPLPRLAYRFAQHAKIGGYTWKQVMIMLGQDSEDGWTAWAASFDSENMAVKAAYEKFLEATTPEVDDGETG